MCDPRQELSNLGGYVERGVRGFTDAIDSGIRGVGGSIKEAAPYIIAAVAAYYGIPASAVGAAEVAGAAEAGAITAADVAVATPYIDAGMVTGTALDAGVAGTAGLGTAGGIADAVPFSNVVNSGTTYLGAGGVGAPMAGIAGTELATQFDLPGSVMNIASSQPGVWDQFVNSLSTPAGVASALKTGAGLTGLFSGISSIRNPGISPQSAQTMADPFAPSRQQYINQLNAVMANPSLTMSQPGYQFQFQEGLQGLNRNLAQRGMGTGTPGQPGVPAAGAAGIAQQRYGQRFAQTSYNDYVNQLAGLAGAKENPSVGATAALNAQKQALEESQRGFKAASQGAGILSDLFSNSQTRKPPPNTTPADVVDTMYWSTPTTASDIFAAPTGWASGYDVPSQDTSSWTSGFDLFD
jgi:hypothetical protein